MLKSAGFIDPNGGLTELTKLFHGLTLTLVVLIAVSCSSEPAVPLVPIPTAIPVATPTPAPTRTPVPTPTSVPFVSTTFKVGAGSATTVSQSMQAGSRIEFQFTADLDINVRLQDPMGAEVGSWDRVTSHGSNFTAAMTGVHQLVFDNSFSFLTAKTVDLKKRIVPPGGR